MKHQGFTLIELLVVVAIIALLTAVLVPGLIGVRDLTEKLLCANNLSQIGLALEIYQQDHDGYAPFLGKNLIDNQGRPVRTPEEMLSIYLVETWDIWHCPADNVNEFREVWFPGNWYDLSPEKLRISYTWSEPVLRGFYEGHWAARGGGWEPVPCARFKGAVLADGNRMLNVWDWREALSADYDYNCLDQSHGSGKYHEVNLLYSNSHVESIECDPETLRALDPW